MEELKVSYSFDYLKEVFNYILIPVFIVLLIVVVGLIIYAHKEKDHTTERYNYTINFWSYLMCIILSAALFAIALSFVVSLHNSIAGRPVDKSKLIYLVYLSPIIPLIFLISTGVHWIRMFLSYRDKNRKDEIDNSTDNTLPDENNDKDNEDVVNTPSELEENNNEKASEDIFDNSSKLENSGVDPIPVTPLEEENKTLEEAPIPIVVEDKPIEIPSETEDEKDNDATDENVEELEEEKTENDVEILDID